jgi:hypothetical protein
MLRLQQVSLDVESAAAFGLLGAPSCCRSLIPKTFKTKVF